MTAEIEALMKRLTLEHWEAGHALAIIAEESAWMDIDYSPREKITGESFCRRGTI